MAENENAENEDIEKVESDDENKSFIAKLLANKKLLIIVAAVLLLIIVGVTAFLLLGSSDEPEAEAAQQEVTETTETEESTAESEELADDLPEEEMTDETSSIELPGLPEESPEEPKEPEEPESASSRLAAISGGLTNPSSSSGNDSDQTGAATQTANLPPVDLPEGVEMPEYQGEKEPEVELTPIMEILEEFNTPEEMAEEIAKLRRKVELSTKETTRIYNQMGDLEDKMREKDRIIRAQDTAYLKGPKVSPKRNTGPIAPPEPTWGVSPQHTGP